MKVGWQQISVIDEQSKVLFKLIFCHAKIYLISINRKINHTISLQILENFFITWIQPQVKNSLLMNIYSILKKMIYWLIKKVTINSSCTLEKVLEQRRYTYNILLLHFEYWKYALIFKAQKKNANCLEVQFFKSGYQKMFFRSAFEV